MVLINSLRACARTAKTRFLRFGVILSSLLFVPSGARAAEIIYNFSGDDGTYRFDVSYTFNDAAGFSDNGARLDYNTTAFNGEQVIVDISYEIRNSADNSLVSAYEYGEPWVRPQSYAQFYYTNQAVALSIRRLEPSHGQAYILVQFPSSETGIVGTNPPTSFSTTPVWINFYYEDGATGLVISRRVTTNLSALAGDCDHSVYEAEIAALELEVADLVFLLADANTLLNEATDLLVTCNAEVIQLAANNTALTAERDALSAEVAALEVDVGSLQTQLSAATATIGTLTSDLASANGTIADQAAVIANLNGALASANVSLAALGDLLDEANAQIGALENSLASTQTDLAVANANIADLSSDLADANATISDQAATIATQDTTIASQAAIILTLEGESDALLTALEGVGSVRAAIELALSAVGNGDVVFAGETEAEKLQSLANAIDGLSKGQRKALAKEIIGKPAGKSDKSSKSEKSEKPGKKSDKSAKSGKKSTK